MIKTMKHFCFVFLTIAFTLAASASESSEFKLPIPQTYEKNCSDFFPCPEALSRRIDFWIEVFSKYGANEVIFHDSETPERVYSVLRTESSCTRRKQKEPRDIQTERNRIHTLLRTVARKIAQQKGDWTPEESAIKQLFPSGDPKEILDSADNVRCQEGNRDRFEEGLKRSGKYKDYIRTALRLNQLPEEIIYLPFVESSYNPEAYSRVGAAGLWQIMPRTGRLLGLKVDATVDERFDPLAATHGAMKYLSESYDAVLRYAKLDKDRENLGKIGPFVITSYNYGLAGVRRSIRQHGPDFVKVLENYQGRRFRTAARNFYASFVAAVYVAKNEDQFFPNVKKEPPFIFDEVFLAQPMSVGRIAETLSLDASTLAEYNPALTERVWLNRKLIPKGYLLRLPKRKEGWEEPLYQLAKLPPEQMTFPEETYVVRRGDTPCQIARRFDVNCREFLRANNIGPKGIIRYGQIVTIPARGPILMASGKTEEAQKPMEIETVSMAVASPEMILEIFGIEMDLFATLKKKEDEDRFFIRVEVEEDFRNYADWLGLPNATAIQKLNPLDPDENLEIGYEVELPTTDPKEIKKFEQGRIDYHRTLQEEFRQRFDIIGQDLYMVRDGDTPASISSEQGIPLWLLKRFNPTIFQTELKKGTSINIPVLLERGEKANETPPDQTM